MSSKKGVVLGAVAPELRLPTEAGQLLDLAQLRGVPVLVSFLSHAA